MTKERKLAMTQLANGLGLPELQADLLSLALIHPSYAREKGDGGDNQRLEFLGDAVIDLVIGAFLYTAYPSDDEGALTKMRATLVCESSLAAAANRLALGQHLLLGHGEASCGGADRSSNLADAFEAVCGAIYLSCGLAPLETLLADALGPEIQMVREGYYGDYKTRLQEIIQREPDRHIAYALLESLGPDHDKRFHSEVLIDGQAAGQGWGRSKKESERAAALEALIVLGEAGPSETVKL